MVWVGCLKGVGKTPGECGDAVWIVLEGCLQYVGRLSGGRSEAVRSCQVVGRLSGSCVEAV